MQLQCGVVSHPGKVREKNEDNYYFQGSTLAETNGQLQEARITLERPAAFAVFDGMGGMSAGEVASGIAARMAKGMFEGNCKADAMQKVCIQANSEICDAMLSGSRKRMGTTASMLMFDKRSFCLCDIGDSPIFLLREGQLHGISYEHSERDTYEKMYGKKPGENQKFKLTQHLGIFPEEMEIEPYVCSGVLYEKDKFLICSDGLTDMVSTEVIRDVLQNGTVVDEIVSELLGLALQNGGRDNITMICIIAEGE